jgi:hypothetical protein
MFTRFYAMFTMFFSMMEHLLSAGNELAISADKTAKSYADDAEINRLINRNKRNRELLASEETKNLALPPSVVAPE